MAIIRLDCNLNGGDSVTPNNELFYRIYGDVDSYTTPIWTTGTALTDANVTVNNDNVIITGVDGATNVNFKIAAVDASFNEGVLSEAVTSLVNICRNPNFDDNSVWDFATGPSASIVDGKLFFNGAENTESVFQLIPEMIAGNTYEVTYTLSDYASAGVRFVLGASSGTAGATRSENGTFTETVVNTSSGGSDRFAFLTAGSPSTFKIDNVIVYDVTP